VNGVVLYHKVGFRGAGQHSGLIMAENATLRRFRGSSVEAAQISFKLAFNMNPEPMKPYKKE
jgi:hypothetical protein